MGGARARGRSRGRGGDGTEQPRARSSGGGVVPRQAGRSRAGGGGDGARPAGTGGGRAARDLGRRPQSRRGRLRARAPSARRYVVIASILADKDVDRMLALSALGDTFVATRSTNSRAVAAGELAARAGRFFDCVETAVTRRRPSSRRVPWPAQTARSWSRPSLSARRPGHRPTAGSRTMSSWRAAQRLRARRIRPRGDRGALVWRRVAGRKDSLVTAMQLLAQTTTDSNDLFGGFKDFFDSDVWLVVRNVFFFFLVVFWLASAFWVYKDARRRIDDPWLLAMAVALGIFPPFLGPLLMFFPPARVSRGGTGARARDQARWRNRSGQPNAAQFCRKRSWSRPSWPVRSARRS